jgi:excisionase family DNA binding protein
MPISHEDLLTLKQAADLVGTTHNTVRNAITKGELESIKLGHNHFVTAEAVTQWAKTKSFRPARQKKSGT